MSMRNRRKNAIVNTYGMKGNASHPLFCTWRSMISRCYYKSHGEYIRYGALGITVSTEWLDFNVFKADLGEKPSSLYQLDRIDTKSNYCKENCRWVTRTENTINSRPRNGRTYKGVYTDRTRNSNKWFASITLNGKTKYVGSYTTQEEAALAYNKAMLEHYGPMSRLNEVEA